jgi:hypothetical protein
MKSGQSNMNSTANQLIMSCSCSFVIEIIWNSHCSSKPVCSGTKSLFGAKPAAQSVRICATTVMVLVFFKYICSVWLGDRTTEQIGFGILKWVCMIFFFKLILYYLSVASLPYFFCVMSNGMQNMAATWREVKFNNSGKPVVNRDYCFVTLTGTRHMAWALEMYWEHKLRPIVPPHGQSQLTHFQYGLIFKRLSLMRTEMTSPYAAVCSLSRNFEVSHPRCVYRYN